MHIVILTPGFPKDESDDTCIPPLQSFARNLSKTSGIKVSIIAFQYPYEKKVYRWNGLPVYACGGHNKKLVGKLLSWKRASNYTKQIHRDNPIDLFHSFWLGECALTGSSLAVKYKAKHICTAMGQDVNKTNKYLALINLKSLTVITITKFQSEILYQNKGKRALKVIPWGLDTGQLPVPKPSLRKIDLLGVGAHTKLKDYKTFIRVARLLHKDHQDIRVTLIGDGQQHEILKAQSKSLNLDQNITFTGKLSRKETLQLMNESRVFFHPSTYESFGMVFLEAQYYGCQIISRPVGWAADAKAWKTGNDDEFFAQEIDLMLQSEVDVKIGNTIEMTAIVREYLKIYGR